MTEAGTCCVIRKGLEIKDQFCIFIAASTTKRHVKCLLIPMSQSFVFEWLAIAFRLFPAIVPSMRGMFGDKKLLRNRPESGW
jgi:hypothetical protein